MIYASLNAKKGNYEYPAAIATAFSLSPRNSANMRNNPATGFFYTSGRTASYTFSYLS